MSALYYALIVSGVILFCLGLFRLKSAFFEFARSLLNLLDTTLFLARKEDEAIHKLLIARLGVLIKRLMMLLLQLSIVVLLAVIPLILYLLLGDMDYRQSDSDSTLFYLCLTLPFFIVFIPFGRKSGYSDWSQLLHHLILDNIHVARMLFFLDRGLFKKKAKNLRQDFVIVTGLARSGTTALLGHLHKTGQFHSLSYANMPFLSAVNIWSKFYRPKGNQLQKRAHDDGMMIDLDSVEAFEEFFLGIFTDRAFDQPGQLAVHELDKSQYQHYLEYQALINGKGQGSVYLAKNNNLILRYKSLRSLNKAFRTLWLFRNPLDHARSLYRQHQHFSDLQKKDSFVRDYMGWLCHYEFGLDHKPFGLPSGYQPHSDYQPEDLEYWLVIWIDYYSLVLEFVSDSHTYLIDFEDLTSQPNRLLASLSQSLGLPLDLKDIEAFDAVSPKPEFPVDESLLTWANDLYTRLKERKYTILIDVQ